MKYVRKLQLNLSVHEHNEYVQILKYPKCSLMVNMACYDLCEGISIDINLWYCIILFSCLDDLVDVYMEKEEKIQGYCKWKNCMFIYFCLVIKGCHQLIFAIFKDFTWWSSHVLKPKHNKISSFFHHEQKVLYISRWK